MVPSRNFIVMIQSMPKPFKEDDVWRKGNYGQRLQLGWWCQRNQQFSRWYKFHVGHVQTDDVWSDEPNRRKILDFSKTYDMHSSRQFEFHLSKVVLNHVRSIDRLACSQLTDFSSLKDRSLDVILYSNNMEDDTRDSSFMMEMSQDCIVWDESRNLDLRVHAHEHRNPIRHGTVKR